MPSPRSGLAVSQPPVGEKVYLFGGVFDQTEEEEELEGQFYNDLYQLDLKKHIWHTGNSSLYKYNDGAAFVRVDETLSLCFPISFKDFIQDWVL